MPAVDLDRLPGQELAQARDPLQRLGHEGLAGVAGVDAHAEREVGAPRQRAPPSSTPVPGLKATPASSPCSRASGDQRARVVGDLDVEGDAVAAGARDLRDVPLGVVDHEVAVEHAAPLVHEAGDRLQDDRADRDRLDEVAVADVEVEDARAGVEQLLDLLARGARSRPRTATARPRTVRIQSLQAM